LIRWNTRHLASRGLRTVEDVELATLAWVDWYNQRRLHGACDNVPPAEFETRYYQQHEAVGAA
jgi:putative transposase